MDPIKLAQIKADLAVVRANNSAISGLLGMLGQTTFPVTGPVVTISTFSSISSIVRMQSDTMDKLLNVLEKLTDNL